MGATKAIIFSTHILEEVDAVCTRAIIIDRGKIVANGTPAELRQKSETPGAVTLLVRGVLSAEVTGRLSGIPQVGRVVVLEEKQDAIAVRAFPKSNSANGELARAIGAAAGGWRIEQLQTEEGRLDEVFRSLTMPDTVSQKSEAGSHRPEVGGQKSE